MDLDAYINKTILQAQVELNKGSYEQVLEVINPAVQRGINHADVWYLRGEANRRLGRDY